MEVLSRSLVIAGLFLIHFTSFSQLKKKSFKLDSSLIEISGLEALNDSTLLAINDSGNSPSIFVLGLNGNIRREIKLNNAKNIDWEDLAIQNNQLVIADIGNNLLERKSIFLYFIPLDSLYKDEVNYTEKREVFNLDYSPFDCEAIASINDSLFLFSKAPLKSKGDYTRKYSINEQDGKWEFELVDSLDIGKKGKYRDAVSAADFYNEHLYLLTYNRIEVFRFENNQLKRINRIKIKGIRQYESIVSTKDCIFVASEKSFGRRQKLYELRRKHVRRYKGGYF